MPGVLGLAQPDAAPFRASPTWMGTHLIGQPSSISSTSTGLSSTPPDSTFVPPSLLARYQPSAPARFEKVHCGGLADRQIDDFAKACKKTKDYIKEHFSDHGESWRHKQCEIVSIYDVTSQGPPGWKTRRNGRPTCSFCLSAINVLGRVIKRLKELQAQEDEPAGI